MSDEIISYDRTKIECPYCHKVNAFEAEDMPYEQDGENYNQCSHCEKEFIITCWDVVYWWKSWPKEV